MELNIDALQLLETESLEFGMDEGCKVTCTVTCGETCFITG